MVTYWSRLFWQDTSHYKVTIWLFHGGDLVSLIIFEGIILYQAFVSGEKIPLVFQIVMYLYFMNVKGK